MKYYTLKNILKMEAQYNVIFSGRSDGKTYAVLEYGLEQHKKDGSQIGLIRRNREDFIGTRGATMFENLVNNGVVDRVFGGEWNDIYYYASRWWLCRKEGDTRVVADEPLAFGFSLSSQEHDKSTAYPHIKTILFDEFISRDYYLKDEFVIFMNVLSTIIRQRNDVKIFMCGNTVNKYCPHFGEMGLTHIKDMKQGDIDVYNYGSSGLRVAVEYPKPYVKGKPSDVYFAFDNPKLQMITSGAWEIAVYPHCPYKYRPCDILFIYFIVFEDAVLQCEIVAYNNMYFTFIHPKTSELKDPDNDIIFSPKYDPRPNWHRKITDPRTPVEARIAEHFKRDKVFYANNETGEIVRNYLMWCAKNKGKA